MIVDDYFRINLRIIFGLVSRESKLVTALATFITLEVIKKNSFL